jgi:hypothetical protein
MYQLLQEMPYDELLDWIAYFEQRPVEWRDDDRTFKLLQVQGVKGKPQAYFSSLEAIYGVASNRNVGEIKDGKSLVENIKNSNLLNFFKSAVGGAHIPME